MKNIQTYTQPDAQGNFGEYGGKFVPPQLEERLLELEEAFLKLSKTKKFQDELAKLQQQYIGRPSLLYFAERLTEHCDGAKIYLKREDLNHTGAHKINNTIGQALLARYMGKKKLIAETGAGQHGVATATVAALMGMSCDVYTGVRDIINQSMNVYRMKMLGAKVIEVTKGQGTLKDAVDEALMAYASEPETYYMLGSAVGPHPYPLLVREFQKVIGKEAKQQMLKQQGKLPDYAIACVGGGSNAMGLFYEFIPHTNVQLIAVEPAGKGANTAQHGLALKKGKPGMIHGFKCRVLQSTKGEILESYSAASGLDYPGVGPELSYLADVGRLQLAGVTDNDAVQAFHMLTKIEGIIPALESAHAVFYAMELAKTLPQSKNIIVNLSGRGDKDVEHVYKTFFEKSAKQG